MEALGITQKELARRLDTSQQRISETLSGKHSPTLETVARFAKALDAEADLRLLSRVQDVSCAD
jgi:transcriptional regulator with XRE-family HTH domain